MIVGVPIEIYVYNRIYVYPKRPVLEGHRVGAAQGHHHPEEVLKGELLKLNNGYKVRLPKMFMKQKCAFRAWAAPGRKFRKNEMFINGLGA